MVMLIRHQEFLLFCALQRLGACRPLLSKHHTCLGRAFGQAYYSDPTDLLASELDTRNDLRTAMERVCHTGSQTRYQL